MLLSWDRAGGWKRKPRRSEERGALRTPLPVGDTDTPETRVAVRKGADLFSPKVECG